MEEDIAQVSQPSVGHTTLLTEADKERMPRTPPPPLGLTLTHLRLKRGWSQKDLAEATGLSRGVISEYETGKTALARDRLEWLASVMGWPPGSVDRTLFGLGLLEPAAELPASPVDPDDEERFIIDQAAAVAARETADALRTELTREVREEKAREARRAAEVLWQRLKPFPATQRRRLVAENLEYHDLFLCERLCTESERAAASDADRALKLAELALFVAEHVPGPPAVRSRLQGYAWAFVGNARRIANHLPAADEAFVSAWRLWREGTDPGLLSEALLLDLEASLRRAQRRFVVALGLHDRALTVAKSGEKAYILLNKAFALEQSGEIERSIETLEEAARLIDGEREPRQLFGLRFNQAVSLLHLGRLAEAERRLAEARELALQLRNELDLVRLLWLDGRMLAARDAKQEAMAVFEQVRREFLAREMAYDFALVSLELAALYLKEEHSSEVKALAQQMILIFKAQEIHREGFAALRLFCEAAEKEEVTADMVHRLIEYLMKARNDPDLRFEDLQPES
jgi:transcriptional regulator with XRE-family HTH domain/tetratricopeptide (TPR) repeat protein